MNLADLTAMAEKLGATVIPDDAGEDHEAARGAAGAGPAAGGLPVWPDRARGLHGLQGGP